MFDECLKRKRRESEAMEGRSSESSSMEDFARNFGGVKHG